MTNLVYNNFLFLQFIGYNNIALKELVITEISDFQMIRQVLNKPIVHVNNFIMR